MQKNKNLIYGTMIVLADMIESRYEGKEGNIERATSHLKALIDGMTERGVYSHELNKFNIDILLSSACMYDVGKISIPEVILNKPGRLSKEEFDIIKTHTLKGEYIIGKIESKTSENEEFLRYAKQFAGSHHELWNGKGYPRGLGKTDIPLLGRIIGIIDVYNALISERPYKTPFAPDEALKIIMDGAGEQFDPLIVDVFLEIKDQLKTVI
ncbi:MAG: HD domain-containing protein [Treponema sp.]|nr:HD domain-containing protein [Treponema sp.]